MASCGGSLHSKDLEQCGRSLGVTLAWLRERLGQDKPLRCIQVAPGPAVETLDPFSLLPHGVSCVSCMGLCVALINAATADEGLEALFIGSFVNGEATLGAPQIAGRF